MKLAFGQGTAAGSDWVKSLSQQFGFEYQEVNTDSVASTVEGTEDVMQLLLHFTNSPQKKLQPCLKVFAVSDDWELG